MKNNIIRKEIYSMESYQANDVDSSKFIKLDAMENPYDWPSDLKEQWIKSAASINLNRYPDSQCLDIINLVKQNFAVSESSQVILGNGSDEIIQLLMLACRENNSCCLVPSPSSSMFNIIAKIVGIKYFTVDLIASNFDLNEELFLQSIDKYNPSIIFIAYPNNPTGNLFSRKPIEKIIKLSKALVVIDEAYSPFTKSSFINDLDSFDNLLVMKTMSKIGFASLRLGILFGSDKYIKQLNKLRLPYNINALTQSAAKFFFQNYDVFKRQAEQICESREKLSESLKNFKEISLFESQANFILFKSLNLNANIIFSDLLKANILIKNLSSSHPLLNNCLRVSIGTEYENNKFISCLNKIINKY